MNSCHVAYTLNITTYKPEYVHGPIHKYQGAEIVATIISGAAYHRAALMSQSLSFLKGDRWNNRQRMC